MPLYPDAPLNQDDELALLDEDDSMDPEDEIHVSKSRTVIGFKPLSPLLSTVRYCSEACSLGWA